MWRCRMFKERTMKRKWMLNWMRMEVSSYCLTSILHAKNEIAEASDSEDEEVNEDEDALPPALAKGERNSQLTVGYKGDRSYVVRGNNIGVFNHDSDNQVKYYATISKISTPKGKEFRPKEVFAFNILLL